MLVSLVDMKPGEKGTLKEIHGGLGVAKRIKTIGMRIGKEIKKERGHSRKGPQTIAVGTFKVAIGFGMASKIFIEVKRDGNK
jgi:ferrous iron transport protein A